MRILDQLGIRQAVQAIVSDAEFSLHTAFHCVEETSEYNQYKVIETFRANNVSARHFAATTGYGYGDEGRETLARVFACVTKAQGAVLSPHIASGTQCRSAGSCRR